MLCKINMHHVQFTSSISLRFAAQSTLACRHGQQHLAVAASSSLSPPPSSSPSSSSVAASVASSSAPSPAVAAAVAAPTQTSLSAPSPAVPAKQHPWLIVGIGNPGHKYEKTRHNVGFEIIDAIAEAEGIKLNTVQHKALTGKGEIGPAQVLLVKPQTYVNSSGESVGPLAAFYQIPVQQILVVFDDMDLEFGVMRLLPKGGHGGHNGMRSVIESLKGCREFPRLKIGIGRPPGTIDPAAFVLQKFDTLERQEMDVLIARGADAIRQVTKEGILKAASTCNQARKSRMQLIEKEREILRQI